MSGSMNGKEVSVDIESDELFPGKYYLFYMWYIFITIITNTLIFKAFL